MPMWIWLCPPPALTEIRSLRMEPIPISRGSRDMDTIIICCNCEIECTDHYWICDRDDGEWCPECWDKTACSQGVHGDECPTQIFGDLPRCIFFSTVKPRA